VPNVPRSALQFEERSRVGRHRLTGIIAMRFVGPAGLI
jgi:hypothetical protein